MPTTWPFTSMAQSNNSFLTILCIAVIVIGAGQHVITWFRAEIWSSGK